jgi:protein-S-isoprenylcysteine O-methyltransferase Ste14
MLRSYTLVVVQFALVIFLAGYGGVGRAWFPNIFLVAGSALGVWAVLAMRFRFNIIPDVRTDQTLVTAGPYGFLRHPMYTALLLGTLGFVFRQPDIVSLLAWGTLFADLLIKLRHEERLLAARFPAYAAYAAQTKRLIPGLF